MTKNIEHSTHSMSDAKKRALNYFATVARSHTESLPPDAHVHALRHKPEREQAKERGRDGDRLPHVRRERHLVGDLGNNAREMR